MRARAPVVRPWKAPSAATMPVRPVRRASLMAASSASAPELQKNTFEPAGAPASDEQPLGELDLRHRGEEVRHVHELTGLLRHGRDQRRVVVAQGVDRDAADEVEVPAAVDVPHPGAVAVLEHELRAAEQVEQRPLVAVEPRVAGGSRGRSSARPRSSGSTMVPMPSEVNTSSSRLCGWRPSTTCAWGTPASTARMHASSLGIIPASTVSSSSPGRAHGQLGEQRVAVGPARRRRPRRR